MTLLPLVEFYLFFVSIPHGQGQCAYYDEFEKPKIVYPIITKEPRFTFDSNGYFCNDKTFIIPLSDFYLLGLLNSKLVWAFLKRLVSVLGDADAGGRLELRAVHMKQLPIRRPNVDDPAEKAQHDEIVKQVETILRLKREQADTVAILTDQRQQLEYAIAAADRKIDAAVYALYGLTDDEIAVVEG